MEQDCPAPPDLPPQAAVPSGERSGATDIPRGASFADFFVVGAPVRSRRVVHLRASFRRDDGARPVRYIEAGRGYTGAKDDS